jgi:hypothetical protein
MEVVVPHSLPPNSVLDHEFLGMRCRLIDLAAALDRIGRVDVNVARDQRLAQIRRSFEILMDDLPDRAERVQIEFSLPYKDEVGIRD